MNPADRSAIVDAAGETIRRGSKSFYLASRLFDRTTRERAWLLYCWCRHCDDCCDDQELGRPGAASTGEDVARVVELSRRVLGGERIPGLPFEALRLVLDECAIPHQFPHDHLRGFELDAQGFQPRTGEDLLTYCYHVAGTVGCMMAIIMGVGPDDRPTLERARDLGLAFQLANIARDVREDHEAGRCYLPLEWMRRHGIDPADPLRNDQREELVAIVAEIAALAQSYQASALRGVPRLPFRARWAVLTAARTYGAIGQRVASLGADAWSRRVVVPRREKLGHLIAALPLSIQMRPAH